MRQVATAPWPESGPLCFCKEGQRDKDKLDEMAMHLIACLSTLIANSFCDDAYSGFQDDLRYNFLERPALVR